MCIEKLSYSTIYLFCLLCFQAFSQNSINSSGTTSLSENGSVSYSVGQTVYLYHSSSTGILVEGVQQDFQIKSESRVAQIKVQYEIFPNPASDIVYINISELDFTQLKYELTDSYGHILFSNDFSSKSIEIDISTISAGSFFLKIIENESILQSIQLIKK